MPTLSASEKGKARTHSKTQFAQLISPTHSPRTKKKKLLAGQEKELTKTRASLKKLQDTLKNEEASFMLLQKYKGSIEKIRLMNCTTLQKKYKAIAALKLPKSVEHYVICNMVPSSEIKRLSCAMKIKRTLIQNVQKRLKRLYDVLDESKNNK